MKRFVKSTGTIFFSLFSCHWHTSSFGLRLFYSVPRIATRRDVPMDADEPLLLDVSEKSSLELRKEEGNSRAHGYKRVLCVRAHRAFSARPSFARFEFLIRVWIRVWNSRRFRPTLPVRPDENGHDSSTRNPRTRPSIEKQIQSSPLNYTKCPLQYGKKEGDNNLVAWRELF